MPNNEIVLNGNSLEIEVSGKSVDELLTLLQEELDVTVSSLKRASVIWQELIRRGCDLSDLKSGLTAYLSDIASGALLPETIIKCAGRAFLLRKLKTIPAAQQKYLLEKGVRVLSDTGDGHSEETVSLDELSVPQITAAFSRGRVRDVREQLVYLKNQDFVQDKKEKRVQVKVNFTNAEYRLLLAKARQEKRRVPSLVHDIIMEKYQ